MDPRVLVVLLAALATTPATDIYLPSLPGMAKYFHVSESSIKDSIVIFQIGNVLSCLALGFLSDQFGRKPLLALGLGTFFTGCLICAFGQNFPLFMLGRFIAGIGSVSVPVSGWALIHDSFDEKKSAKIMSMIGASFSVVPLVSPTIGGYVDVSFGWRWNFAFLAAFSFMALLFLLWKLEEPQFVRAHKVMTLKNYVTTYKNVISNRIFLFYVLIFASLILGEWFYLTHVPYFLESKLGMGPKECGIYIALVSISYLSGAVLTPSLIKSFDLRKTVMIGLGVTIIGAIIFLFLASLDINDHKIFALAMSIFLFGSAIIWSPSTTISLQAVGKNKGVASSVRSLFYVSAGASGGFLASLVRSASLTPASLAISFCAFAALVIFVVQEKLTRAC